LPFPLVLKRQVRKQLYNHSNKPPTFRQVFKPPDKVETSIGTLAFFDGAPTQQTAQLLFDNLDRMHGVEAFLKGMPGASIYGLYSGQKSIGDGENHQVVITENLLDSKSFNLTANTSTLYATPFITTKEVGVPL